MAEGRHAASHANPRAAAARVIAEVLGGRSLDQALEPHQARLESRDRGLCAELAYGVCRWYRRLEALAGTLLKQPLRGRDRDVQALLLVGIYQLLYTRVPAHAAVAETAGAARTLGKPWATALLNGVLRGLQRDSDALQARVDADPAVRHAQPDWFLEAMQAAWPERWEEILEALQQRPPMTVRVNCARLSTADYARRLAEQGLSGRPVAAVPGALILDRPVEVARLPGFAEGLVSVQDAGAQLAAPLLDPRPGQRVLDACAAPGGKTGQLLEQAAPLKLTAVDLDPQRLERVRDNLRRLGLEARLAVGDAGAPAGEWARERYQRILADVPCSATGVMRRHPDIRLLRRADDIAPLVARQAAILEALWSLLEPGGKLLYVTCSLLPVENEQQVLRFLDRHPDATPATPAADWGRARGPGRQTLPGEAGMDGFFYALLEKSPC